MAGKAKGRRLVAPAGAVTRPTPDRVREATLNALNSLDAVRRARVLDLFAGTGALGIEALSRGAASAVFVENNRRALRALRANVAATGLADHATVMDVSVDVALTELLDAGANFDVAMCDPPYAFDGWHELLPRIPARLLVIESNRPVALGDRWHARRTKRYGATVVTIASSCSRSLKESGASQ